MKSASFQGRNYTREWYGRELAALQPMDSRSIDRDGFFSADVRTILEVAMLTLLLGLQIET